MAAEHLNELADRWKREAGEAYAAGIPHDKPVTKEGMRWQFYLWLMEVQDAVSKPREDAR